MHNGSCGSDSGTCYQELIDAASADKDEFVDAEGVTNESVKKALEIHQSKQNEKLANQIVCLLEQAEVNKTNLIYQIRQARKTEKCCKTKLSRLEESVKYGKTHNNFCPLLKLLGFPIPEDKIPEEMQKWWKKA
jgi:hypothetical protein